MCNAKFAKPVLAWRLQPKPLQGQPSLSHAPSGPRTASSCGKIKNKNKHASGHPLRSAYTRPTYRCYLVSTNCIGPCDTVRPSGLISKTVRGYCLRKDVLASATHRSGTNDDYEQRQMRRRCGLVVLTPQPSRLYILLQGSQVCSDHLAASCP